MNKYTDLNKIVQEYLISRGGSVEELRTLQKRLSNVPVDLRKFEEQLADEMFSYEFSELRTRAELYDPSARIGLLEDLVEYDEANEITEHIVLPFPIIYISGEVISDHFYADYQPKLGELIMPDERDKTARVISDPKCNGVAILFERDNKLHYIEMVLVRDLL